VETSGASRDRDVQSPRARSGGFSFLEKTDR
jgi:hypothetical protein